MASVIIIDEMHPSIVDQLSADYQVDYRPDIQRDELLDILAAYQGLIVRSKTVIDHELLERASSLQFVARAGAGVDNLDEKAIEARGIRIINAPEGNRDSLGEHMVGMLLNLLHRINAAHQAVVGGTWDREAFRGSELGGKIVGIIGCGNMGNAFARRLSGFGCKVLGYDKYLPTDISTSCDRVALDQLFTHCDIVSLHVPLTNETRRFYNYSFFQQFQKQLILLNSARGEILPLKDLVELMKEEKIKAAALDVFEKEPLVELSGSQKDTYDYLVDSPVVLLTPHVAGWSYESYRRINEVLVTKIRALKQEGIID